MARGRRRTSGLIGLALVVGAASVGCRGPNDPGRQSPPSPVEKNGTEAAGGSWVPVLRVVDGDTFHVLRHGRDVTIRLIGIDTPEVGWYGGAPECYGASAGRFLRDLVDGERVRLEFDIDRIDPYQRTLAYAYLGDGRMVNSLLVRRGFARVTIYQPNDRYEGQLRAAERAARADGAGLWSACA